MLTTNTYIFILFLLQCFYITCKGQNTYYYRQEKIIDRFSKNMQNGAYDKAGMFITFNSKGCYDSDKKGFDVGNGFRNEISRNNKYITYIGPSFWGEAEYITTLDKDRINIKTISKIYVYARADAPIGKKKSSLIKNQNDISIPMPSNGTILIEDKGQYKEELKISYTNSYLKYENSLKSAFDAYERLMSGSHDSSRAMMGTNIVKIQSEMRRLRSEAQKKGIYITISPWENAQPKPGTIHYESN